MVFAGDAAENDEPDDGHDASGTVSNVAESRLTIFGEGKVYQDGLHTEDGSCKKHKPFCCATSGEKGAELTRSAGQEKEGHEAGGAEHEGEPTGGADGGSMKSSEEVVDAKKDTGDEGEADGLAVLTPSLQVAPRDEKEGEGGEDDGEK